MKKASNIFATMITVILLCGVTVSCSKDDDNDKQETAVNKTVFVFLPYADNLTTNTRYLMADINEMKSAIKKNGNMNGYRVLVYYGSSSFNAVLYEMKLKDGSVINDTLKTYSNITQSDQQHLTNVFSLVKSLSPTQAYTLIIGGHGSGWTPSDVNLSNIPQPSSVTTSAKRKSFGAINREADRIETATLSNAMTAASFHPDLTIFDCCYMDNIESIYDLHTNTDYIIASAAEQAVYGMPYANIWNYITPTMSRDNIKSIMNASLTYYDTDSGLRSETAYNVNPLSLSAIDCSEVDNIAAAMANLNKKYGECTTDLTDSIQRFDKKYVSIFFDLLDYAKYQAGGSTTDSYYQSLESAVNSAVITTACRGWYHVVINSIASVPNCWPVTTFCGITTSDPSQNSTYIIEKKKLTNWWKATH